MTDLSSLPRFPISIILSYLQQSTPTPPTQNNNGALTSKNKDTTTKTTFPLPHNRDALSFLLTNKRLSYSILPLFKVPKHICRNYEHQTKDGTWIAIVEKYRFIVLPIQDPTTLLDRLNTKRLRGRIVWLKRLQNNKTPHHNEDDGLQQDESTAQDGIEVNYDANISSDTTSSNHQHTVNSNNRMDEHTSCYQYGRTIQELAYEEWTMMEINHNNSTTQKEEENHIQQWRIWPAHLELLRFLDNDNDSSSARNGEIYEQSSQEGRHHGKLICGQRRIIPSPFCFNKQFKNTTTTTTTESTTMNVQQTLGNDITLLASYPRSGNTLLRTLLERTTSIVTGSDTRPDRTLSKSLALDHGLVGEGLVGPGQMMNHQPKTTIMKTKKSKSTATSSSQQEILYQTAYDPLVHIVKTHFPERKGWKPVPGNKVLLLVRNPYDAIDSYWNLCCTNTHTRSLDESVYIKYASKFEDLVKHEIEIWCKFHYYWMDICAKENVPILIVRYEDLVLDTEGEMTRVMEFLMEFLMNGNNNFDDDSASIMKSFWEWRIRHAIGKTEANETNTSNLGSYQPRSLGIGKSIRKKRYSESVLSHMHELAVSMELDRKQNSTASKLHVLKSDKQQSNNKTLLQRFGYDIYSQQFPENFKQKPLPELLLSPPHHVVLGKINNSGTVVINKTPEIRNKEDPFGRAMTYWRRGETDGDRNPFPTIPR